MILSRKTTCAIIAEGRDSKVIISFLRNIDGFELELITPGQNLSPGERFTDAIVNDIRYADIVIVVLDEDVGANFWIEVGIAVAVNRPTILVRTSPDAPIPSDLSKRLTVGPVLSSKALELAIRRAREPARREVERQFSFTGRPLGEARATRLLNSLAEQDGSSSPTDFPRGARLYIRFEDWFADLLDAASVSYQRSSRIVSEGRGPHSEIDFVATADELTANLGPVLPIELLLNSTRGMLRKMISSRMGHFRQYLLATGADMLLIVVRNLEESPEYSTFSDGSLLIVSAADLVDWMRDRTFGSAVIAIRNAAIHKERAW